MTRDLTDEEKAIVYVDNTHCKYNEVLSRPYVASEIRKAYIAGLTQERKELQAQIKKMKSLLKEVFEEYGFGELVKVRNGLPLEIQEIIGEKEDLGL